MNMHTEPLPPSLLDDVRRLADVELSLPSRLRYVLLALAAMTMTSVVTALWLTEPRLPVRTQVAFAVLAGIGCCWTAYAAWVLTRRRVLLGGHRIVAGRMAVAFCAVFVIGALTVGYVTAAPAAPAAAGLGVLMLLSAIVLLIRAHRAFARLTAKRARLEHARAGAAR